MKTLTIFLTVSCFSILTALSGQVSGKIQLKTDDGVITQEGDIFIGDISYLSDKNFPDYLSALCEATNSDRISKIDADGNFAISSVPENKDLIAGINFYGVSYFIKIKLKTGENLSLNRVLDLTLAKKDFKVKAVNNTGIVFNATFAGISYLMSDDSEGWVFNGSEPADSIIDLKQIPLGNYSFAILNKQEEGQSDRIDEKNIEVKEGMQEEVTFSIE